MTDDVLVVGAGPIGLTCSILLSQLGVSHRVLERREGLHLAPQAHVVSARTMEILRAAGVDEQALRAVGSRPDQIASVRWVHTLAGPELGRISLLTPERVAKLLHASPTPPANISQHRLEPVLLAAALEAGAAVDFGHEVQALEQDADSARVRGVAGAGAEPFEARARYVLACDGASSPMRRALGIEMEGPARIQTFMNLFFEADLTPLVGDRPAILYWHMDPESPGVFIAHDIASTWIYMTPIDPDVTPPGSFSDAVCRERVQRALGADLPFVLRNVDTWVMTAQLARRYREGRAFLVGDAAHRFPPTGGIGMNTGIADAANLVWKLEAVLRGRAAPELLDSYEAERRGVARVNSEQSLRNAMRMAEVVQALAVPPGASAEQARAHVRSLPDDPDGRRRVQAAIDGQQDHFDTTGLDLGFVYSGAAIVSDGTTPPEPANPVSDYAPHTGPGARLPHAWVMRDGARISTLDLQEPGRFLLLVGPEGGAWRGSGIPTLAIGPGCEIEDPEGSWAALRGTAADGALLVRPDGHVAWRAAGAPEDPGASLADALARIHHARGGAPDVDSVR